MISPEEKDAMHVLRCYFSGRLRNFARDPDNCSPRGIADLIAALTALDHSLEIHRYAELIKERDRTQLGGGGGGGGGVRQ